MVGEKRWEISNKQFFDIIEKAMKDFYNENYNPKFDEYQIKEPPENIEGKYKDKHFVYELTSISCPKEEIEEAIVDYWRTVSLLGEENQKSPSFYKSEYTPYRMEVLKRVRMKKNEYKHNVEEKENNRRSLDFYIAAIQMQFQNQRSIQSYTYFSHGTMQNLVEDTEIEFSWIL